LPSTNENHLYAAGDSELKVFSIGRGVPARLADRQTGICVAVSGDGSVYVGQEGK
jgi:hypothetical protein